MTRFILPIIFVGLALACFFMLTRPLYEDISLIRAQAASYNEALGNSKALENERDKLTAKYNTIDSENLARLQKLLPDGIDNIRLILEIEKIASPYGMVLKDVQYDANDSSQTAQTGIRQVQGTGLQNKNYGIWNLQFTVSGAYANFVNFTRDLESNLRIVDVAAVGFSSSSSAQGGASGVYTYNFKIKTYWLKN